MCIQVHVIKECGCYDMGLPDSEDILLNQWINKSTIETLLSCQNSKDFPNNCDNDTDACVEALLRQYQRIICARNVSDAFAEDWSRITDCKCYPPCNEIIYDASYSLSQWPGKGFEGAAVWHDLFDDEEFLARFNSSKTERDLYKEYFSFENWTNAKNDFARINIYMADSNMVRTQESPDYDVTQLISDTGGQLGVWLGMSVVSFSETFTLLGQIMRYFLCPRSIKKPEMSI